MASVVTRCVRYGQPHAVIQFRGRTERPSLANLSDYVTEKENYAASTSLLGAVALLRAR